MCDVMLACVYCFMCVCGVMYECSVCVCVHEGIHDVSGYVVLQCMYACLCGCVCVSVCVHACVQFMCAMHARLHVCIYVM